MIIITKILATLVALEFLYIMYLETIATTSEKTSKVFGMDKEELERKSVNTSKIILMQGGLAILTLISCVF